MKKQLLIAAVAASMTSVAMADISLSGDVTAAVKHTAGGAVVNKNEVNLTVTGKSDAGTAVVTMTSTAAGDFEVDESYVKTTIGGINLAIGNKDGRKGTAMTHGASASSRAVISSSVAGVGVAATFKSGDANPSITLKGKVAGFGVKMQNALNDGRYTTVTGDVAGISVVAEIADSGDAFSISKDLGSFNLTYASIDAGANDNGDQDSMFGNIDGQSNISGVVVSTSTAFGKVTLKDYSSDTSETTKVTVKNGNVSYTFADVDGVDSIEAKVKFSF